MSGLVREFIKIKTFLSENRFENSADLYIPEVN